MVQLISEAKTNDYLVDNNLVKLNNGVLDLGLTEYVIAKRKLENGRKVFNGNIYYDVAELIDFMKDMTFEMVPGYPNTKTKHVDRLVSSVITTLVEKEDIKDIRLLD